MPQYEGKSASTPKWVTQWAMRACAQVVVEISESEIAFGHLVKWPMIVKRCITFLDCGRGPTVSMCLCMYGGVGSDLVCVELCFGLFRPHVGLCNPEGGQLGGN